MTTLNLQVGASADDAHESRDGVICSTSNASLALHSSTSGDRYINTGGFRWTGVTIPQAETINTATLSLYVEGTSMDDPRVDIYAHDVDNSATFSCPSDGPHDRTGTKTTATVAWDGDALGAGWASPGDCAAIVQEIVDRGSWASGNALSFLVMGRDTVTKYFTCESYDGDTSLAAKLDIDHGAAGGGHREYPRGAMRGSSRGVL